MVNGLGTRCFVYETWNWKIIKTYLKIEIKPSLIFYTNSKIQILNNKQISIYNTKEFCKNNIMFTKSLRFFFFLSIEICLFWEIIFWYFILYRTDKELFDTTTYFMKQSFLSVDFTFQLYRILSFCAIMLFDQF